jgi:hypothetical protein
LLHLPNICNPYKIFSVFQGFAKETDDGADEELQQLHFKDKLRMRTWLKRLACFFYPV